MMTDNLKVTTHLDTDTILSLIVALKAYDGALLVVTHDRFFMRAVVEGESAYSISNVQQEDQTEDESEDDDEDESKKPGIVYRMFKGQLRLLHDGMNQYEDIAVRAAAKLTAKS
jgi:ATP-binding cassette subfamily F protein 3